MTFALAAVVAAEAVVVSEVERTVAVEVEVAFEAFVGLAWVEESRDTAVEWLAVVARSVEPLVVVLVR